MSKNPYAFDPALPDMGQLDPDPPRTSLLAILSLVTSLTCCLSPVGVLTGVIALASIAASKGRVKGGGLALAGVVIGLILSLILGITGFFAYKGVSQFNSFYFSQSSAIFEGLEAGDHQAVRDRLVPPLDTMSDAEFQAFTEAYRAVLGSYAGTPDSFFSMLSDPAFQQLAQQTQQQTGPGGDKLPTLANFVHGSAIVLISVDPNAARGASGSGGPTSLEDIVLPVRDIEIMLPDGTQLRLSDFDGPDDAAPPPSPAPPTTPPPSPTSNPPTAPPGGP